MATSRQLDIGVGLAVPPFMGGGSGQLEAVAQVPVTSRYVAQLIEAMGVDRVIVLEPHNPAAFDNAFRIPAERIHARGLLLDALPGRAGVGPAPVRTGHPGSPRGRLDQRGTCADR